MLKEIAEGFPYVCRDESIYLKILCSWKTVSLMYVGMNRLSFRVKESRQPVFPIYVGMNWWNGIRLM